MRAITISEIESISQILFDFQIIFSVVNFLAFLLGEPCSKTMSEQRKCSLGNLFSLLEEYHEIPSHHSSPS